MEDKELEKSSIGGVVMSRRSKYSAEEKLKIVEACLSGKIGVCEAGDRIGVVGVDEKNIRRWMSRYKAEGVSAFLPSERNRTYPAEMKRQVVEEYLACLLYTSRCV